MSDVQTDRATISQHTKSTGIYLVAEKKVPEPISFLLNHSFPLLFDFSGEFVRSLRQMFQYMVTISSVFIQCKLCNFVKADSKSCHEEQFTQNG